MKRYIYSVVLLSIIFMSFVSAGGVGISPAYYKEFFEPGLTKTFDFHSFNANSEEGLSIYVKGDLAQYVTLSKTSLVGGGDFSATINLPKKLDKPGPHEIYIGVIESKDIGSFLLSL